MMKGLKKDFQSFLKIIMLVPINMFLTWLHNFWNFNDIKNIFYFDVLIIAFKKMFEKCNNVNFSWTFYSRRQVWNMFWNLKKDTFDGIQFDFLLSN